MRVLIFGGGGMLGHKLVQVWKNKFEVFTTIRREYAEFEKFGIIEKKSVFEQIAAENTDEIRKIVRQIKPDVLVNAIGIVKQLKDSADLIRTLQINSIFPHQLAQIAKKAGARLITISTDCVFDGKKGGYTEQDIPNASDLYGMSKILGEVTSGNCLTLRTSIIGRELSTGHSLIEWFLSNRGKKVKGFSKAIYTGFPTIEIADIIASLIQEQTDLNGLYHLSGNAINKYELLKLVNKYFRADIEIEPSPDFQIDRSLDSTALRRITGFQPKSWEEMISRLAADITPYDDWRK